jgi:hypothetical protein
LELPAALEMPIYWSVQSVDFSGAGSPFAPEQIAPQWGQTPGTRMYLGLARSTGFTGFNLLVRGIPRAGALLQTSSNLTHWVDLGSFDPNADAAGSVGISATPDTPVTFFRAVSASDP